MATAIGMNRPASPSPPPSSRTLNRNGRSASDGAHGPRRRAEPGLVDVVLELLSPDRVADDGLEVSVGRPGAHRVPEIRLVHREEASPELAVGREPDAVAIRAERFRHRADESDLAPPIAEAEDPRGGVRLARNFLERMG